MIAQYRFLHHNESSGVTEVARIEENIDLEIALTRVGGFGRFQSIISLCMGIVRNAGCALVFLFAYLTLP